MLLCRDLQLFQVLRFSNPKSYLPNSRGTVKDFDLYYYDQSEVVLGKLEKSFFSHLLNQLIRLCVTY